MTLVRPILEYGAACWDLYREGQIHELERCKRKRLYLHIIRMSRTGKHCYSVERYHIYVLSSKHTLENGRGRLQVTDYNGPTIWAGLIMNGKSVTEGKGRISGNIPLWLGPSDSGTGHLYKFYGLSPVNQMLLDRGLGEWLMWWNEGNESWL
jgi:hypothetical protein